MLSRKVLKDSLLRLPLVRPALVQANYRFAGTDTLKDKEKGDERVFFTKQDGKSALYSIVLKQDLHSNFY